ncbi:hypothetical protein LCGC14_0515150 [marine sediment metagenome]|uniref:Uncharacterized protein n=1 Tax=marine sediment metagenome TaxID=412755 RepID=A0A0F9S4Y6_9ZZZZ
MKLLVGDDECRTQEKAMAHHNKRKEVTLGLSHIFQLWKENNTEAIESLRKNFDPRWLVLSDRIIYDKENLSAKIIHNANSTVTKQTEINLKEVPYCNPTYLKDLLDKDTGLEYIRALINNKKATKEQIINFFVTLSGKKEKNIRFWTPSQSSRKGKQVRSVGLYFNDLGRFIVGGDNWFVGDGGLSRGVIIDSAKQTKKRRKSKCRFKRMVKKSRKN